MKQALSQWRSGPRWWHGCRPDLLVHELRPVPQPGQPWTEPLLEQRSLCAAALLRRHPCLTQLRGLGLALQSRQLTAQLLAGDHAGFEAQNDVGQAPALTHECQAFPGARLAVPELNETGAETRVQTANHRSEITGHLRKFTYH